MTRLLIMLLLVSQMESLPLLNITTAVSWPSPVGEFYYGDVRAVVSLPPVTAAGNSSTEIQVWWRRNDMTPESKRIIVTNSKGQHMRISVSGIANACGQFTLFRGSEDGTEFHIYYLAHNQSGGGSHLHFNWWNCTNPKDESCVLSSSLELCSEVLPGAAYVKGLENRPQPNASSDHTPTGEPFHGFTEMELIATETELAAVKKNNPLVATFMEDRIHVSRMFNFLPARWALLAAGSSIRTFQGTAQSGEYFAYQIGLFPFSDISINRVLFSDLSGPQGMIASSLQNCFNTEGVDMFGSPFTRNIELKKNTVTTLWLGIDMSKVLNGTYCGDTFIELGDGTRIPHGLCIKVEGQTVDNYGDDDIYKMRRLRWLNSNRGLDSTIPPPYVPIIVAQGTGENRLSAKLVNKLITISDSGLPSTATVFNEKTIKGNKTTFPYKAWGAGMRFAVTEASTGDRVSFLPTEFSVSTAADKVSWTAVSTSIVGKLILQGSLSYDSYLGFNATFDLNTSVADISLVVPTANPKYTVGMGNVGSHFKPFNWTWNTSTGDNRIWLGHPHAGLLLILKGEGPEWDNPLFSRDYPIIPFIPSSWGGVLQESGKHGATITEESIATNSGKRGAGVVSFLFDAIVTPAKVLNMTSHWSKRYFQVGYDTKYISPENVASKGATVATLHQGTGGIVNNTMVNPYINYPFVPDAVALMENYTKLSHELDMRVKFYYTIRELSNHAVELFALRSLEGEIIINESPYVIEQKHFCHDWDCHGGGVYLHEHLSTNYTSCWQNFLSNGEWDTAVCDIGTSRWFNYYIEGLHWSVSKPPHMDGIYFDGINFDYKSMQRVRKVVSSAAIGKKFTPEIDIHTGNVGAVSPPGPRYAPYFAHADLAWNGEGFNYSLDDGYWLVEVSAFIYGIPADRLGGGDSYEYKSLLFGMTERNSALASYIWQLWDSVNIHESQMISYFDPFDIQPVTLSVPNNFIKIVTFLNYRSVALVCVASWGKSEQVIHLSFNWEILGGNRVTATAPEIKRLQNATDLGNGTDPIRIPPGGGIVVILSVHQ